MFEKRSRQLNSIPPSPGPVLYWMSRDQRLHDNWAFLAAQNHALETSSPVYILFVLSPAYPKATIRHYSFMIEGLKEVEKACQEYGIPFLLRFGTPPDVCMDVVAELKPGRIFTDFDPLHIKQSWKKEIQEQCPVSLMEVDAHNIIPAWTVSQKNEYSAATFRKKYNRLIDNYLEDFPPVRRMDKRISHIPIEWEKLHAGIACDRTVSPVAGISPGYSAGTEGYRNFLSQQLDLYEKTRNDPVADSTSCLSPWLHFGQISSHRIVLEMLHTHADEKSKEAFWNEIVIWKEISDNLCLYSSDYDSPAGFHTWAQETLKAHLDDRREYTYTLEQFESGSTHEALWNAAQHQLITEGRIHGYMRMYWAKKILEWTDDYSTAYDIALTLNDRYSLDGRDPNGYAGVSWAIGGVHDHPWFDRPIYGKIRYMNENGCRRKFDVDEYIRSNSPA